MQISDVHIYDRSSIEDFRGTNAKLFDESILEGKKEFSLIECLYIYSKKNVLRGIHYQERFPQSRIVVPISGELLCIFVDIRKESKTFGVVDLVQIDCKKGLYVPSGMALGTLALLDSSFMCMIGENGFYPEYSRGIFWDDDSLGINWPDSVDKSAIIISEKDKTWPTIDTINIRKNENEK